MIIRLWQRTALKHFIYTYTCPLVQCLCASTLFYCAHWQTYVSGKENPPQHFINKTHAKDSSIVVVSLGTLQFGKIDITEGQFVVMGVMIVSSIASFLEIDIWNIDVSIFLL